MTHQKLIAILLLIGTYLFTAGISYAVFSSGVGENVAVIGPQPEPTKTQTGAVMFDPSLPKTESCPLNGTKYSKQQRQWWEKHRPLGVMIENHMQSRPQSGLSFADVVYEAVAEGGITRLLAVFYCQDAEYIGPVRSARTFFLDWISEYGDYPLYAHVGGAGTPGPADALGQIVKYGWKGYNDLDQFGLGCPVYCQILDRLGDGDIAIEHTMYSSTTKLWDVAKSKRQLTEVDEEGNKWDEKFVEYSFEDEPKLEDRGSSQDINLGFWEGYKQYAVEWKYNRQTNSYERFNGGVPHKDKNNDKQLIAKNVVILSMRESVANDGYDQGHHLLYKNTGTGKARVFQNGKEILGTWRKDNRVSRTLIFDTSGSAVEFVRGNIWFEILPLDAELVVK